MMVLRLSTLVLAAILGQQVTVQQVILQDRFDGVAISRELWRVKVGAGKSFAKLEPREGGKCIHLFGDRANTNITTRQSVANIAYTLEYDFLQPTAEVGGYQAIVHHPRPQGNSYWWLEYGPERFFLYTIAGGVWYNRWQAGGIPTNRWFHIRIRNTATSVRVSIFDEAGKKLLAQSPLIPHDDGGSAPIVFAAGGTKGGVWGMKIDNVHLFVTPIVEREDYQYRRSALESARKTMLAEETKNLWAQADNAFASVEQVFKAITEVEPQDWSAYVDASHAFDEALHRLSKEYHESVLARLDKRQGDWITVDLWDHFNAEAALQGIALPDSGPRVEVKGIPFILLSFGRNCLWQDLPTRSQYSIKLNDKVKLIALLLAPKYDTALYARDDSLVDVLQVELRYIDGFRERLVPIPAGWQPPLPSGTGRPPMKAGQANAYIIEPGHRATLAEVVMCDGATQAGWALLGISYKEGLPTEVPLMRVKQQQAQPVKTGPARAIQTAKQVIIKNLTVQLVLDAKVGLIRSLRSSSSGELIRANKPSPIFAVQLGDQLIYSDKFPVTNIEINERKGGVSVIEQLRGPDGGKALEVTVNIYVGETGTLNWQAELKNLGDIPIEPRFIFPLLDGIDLGKRASWYFPQRGGASSDLPLEGLSSYGGMAWLQLLDVYRAGGGGVYMRSDDTSGTYKIFALRSSNDEKIKPRRVADIPKPAHPIDPWRARRGVHLSIQYLPCKLSHGQTWSPPPSTICLHQGDWHTALTDYRAWLRSWWKPLRPCPKRYRYGFFALVGGAPRDDQRGSEFGSYDWWHIGHFWTIDYPSELRDKLDALRGDAKRSAQWGQAVGVYIEGMVLEKKRRVAKEHGAEWAMMDDKGSYYSYYSTKANPVWNMCPKTKSWQKFDASAYAKIAKDVPLCAMYVDSTGSRWAEVCYNPAHHHNTPGIWVRGCAELFEAIRQAVMKVSPETAIHSEEPGSDYMAMHEDGSWSHSLWTALSGDEAYNPAGINYFRFALPQFKMYEIPSYRHALWRCKLAFFNGEGLWTNVPNVLRRELFIRWFPLLRKYAEIFLSDDAEPAIPVVEPPLYMNRFRRGEQTIYTAYNAGLRTRIAEVVLPIPEHASIVDLLKDTDMPFEQQGKQAIVRMKLDPHEVACFMIAPASTSKR